MNQGDRHSLEERLQRANEESQRLLAEFHRLQQEAAESINRMMKLRRELEERRTQKRTPPPDAG